MLSVSWIFHIHFKSCFLRSFCQYHLLSFCFKLLSQNNLFSQKTNVFFFPILSLNVSDHTVTKPLLVLPLLQMHAGHGGRRQHHREAQHCLRGPRHARLAAPAPAPAQGPLPLLSAPRLRGQTRLRELRAPAAASTARRRQTRAVESRAPPPPLPHPASRKPWLRLGRADRLLPCSLCGRPG